MPGQRLFFRHTATIDVNRYPTSFSLQEGGKATGHRVKYSHHPDGMAHFSQDGKIFTTVRKRSVPLTDKDGHIFTIQLQGLEDFQSPKQKEQQKILTRKKTILNFKFDDEQPAAIKFVGHWYSKASLMQRMHGPKIGPLTPCQRSDGSTVSGMLIADPFLQSHDEYYLLLTCEGIPILDKDHDSALTFIGGFDPDNIAFDHSKDTQFLALAYGQFDSHEDLIKLIGTVDFTPKPPQGECEGQGQVT